MEWLLLAALVVAVILLIKSEKKNRDLKHRILFLEDDLSRAMYYAKQRHKMQKIRNGIVDTDGWTTKELLWITRNCIHEFLGEAELQRFYRLLHLKRKSGGKEIQGLR
jgi:hypothetical protein